MEIAGIEVVKPNIDFLCRIDCFDTLIDIFNKRAEWLPLPILAVEERQLSPIGIDLEFIHWLGFASLASLGDASALKLRSNSPTIRRMASKLGTAPKNITPRIAS